MIVEAMIIPSQWISGMNRLNPTTRSAGRFPIRSICSSNCFDRRMKDDKTNNSALEPITLAANIGKNAADSISVKVVILVPGTSWGRVRKTTAQISSAMTDIARSIQ